MIRLAMLLAVLLSGCADLTTKRIEATDNSVFLPEARVSVDISPRGDNPAVPHTGHGIELGVTGGKGDDKQVTDAGDRPVVFGGRTFTSPVELRHEFDFRFASLAYRYRHFFGGPGGTFGIEGVGGLGYAELDLEVASATQRAQEKLGSGGIVLGVGLVWKFWPTTSLQSRLTVFGSGDDEGVSSASRLDVYVVQSLGRHAAVRAGWASWGVRSVREDNEDNTSGKSPINVRLSGPALGLEVMF